MCECRISPSRGGPLEPDDLANVQGAHEAPGRAELFDGWYPRIDAPIKARTVLAIGSTAAVAEAQRIVRVGVDHQPWPAETSPRLVGAGLAGICSRIKPVGVG